MLRYTDETAQPPAATEPEVKDEPTKVADIKAEDTNENGAENGEGGDEQMYGGQDDMEDEIDFNLGNGDNYDTPTSHEAHGPGIKEDG